MVGVDEVGRGALAGPLLVVAARPISDFLPDGLRDSKLLTRQQRETIFGRLTANFEFGEGWVTPLEIDRLGLGRCLKLGVRRALNQLLLNRDDEIVMDGIVNYLPKKFICGRCEVDADDHLPVVSAASIYAKVRRDRFMTELSKRHQQFNFAKHVGYGTREHYLELERNGPLKFIHRYSFEPIRRVALL